jgi:hypothetical protein
MPIQINNVGLTVEVNAVENTILSDIEAFSREIANVKTSDNVLLGVKGLLVGSAFSLMKAHQLGFSANVGCEYSDQLDRISQELVKGQLPEGGLWLAGFFFNSALMRIAAGYHILLRRMFSVSDGSREKLAKRAIEECKVNQDDIDMLNKVYQDVNDFKHEGGKLLKYRRIESINDAILAGQKLISLFELKCAQLDNPADVL